MYDREKLLDWEHNRSHASQGRLLYIPTFKGHVLFPVILVKGSIREMVSKELCLLASEQSNRDPIRSRT
jgi:hypothetical protein